MNARLVTSGDLCDPDKDKKKRLDEWISFTQNLPLLPCLPHESSSSEDLDFSLDCYTYCFHFEMQQLTPRPHIMDKICQGAVAVRSIHLFSSIPPWYWNLTGGTPWTETQTTIHTHIHMVDLESPVSLALLSACLWSVGGSWREQTQTQ